MKKLLLKLIKSVFAVALVAMTFCALSCASSTGGANESGKIDANNLVGSWFWNYGYDQEQFCNEQVTFNKDGTVYLFSIGPDWAEWDKGNWSIIDDSEQGPTLFFHLTEGKDRLEDEWYSIDAKIFYSIQSITQNRILMSRYKRDLTGMGWIVQEFAPEVKQDYTRIKDGTKENLVGKWTVNKRGTPGIDWDETWIFNKDGTMEDYWTEAGNGTVQYNGKYEVIKEETGSVLHTTLVSEQNGSGTFELNPPMEFWIDYKTCGENLIKVRSLRNIIGGEKHNSERDSDDFYYREIPLETVTYHWDNYIFNDYYPKGDEYETLDFSKMYLFKNIPEHLLEQKLEGWYDNSELKGNAISKISASDTGNHEYWAKWALNLRRSDWIDDNTKEQVHNHEFYLPINLLTPYMEFPESMENSFPKKGDTVYIVLTGKISDDYKAPWQLRIVDSSDGWFMIGDDWHYAEIEKGNFTHVFEVKMTENARTTDLSKIELNLCYWQDHFDEPRTISDFKFEILDGNSPKIIEHTLNYGNFIFKQKSVAGYDFTLPTQPDNLPHQTNYWTQQGNDFLGWYDNPDFKGNPVKSISGAENTKGKTFYGKYNLKFYQPEAREDGNYYSNRWILAKTVTPNTQIDPKKGDVVMVVVSGTLSQEYEGPMGLDLHNFSFEDSFLANDWHYVETKNKKFATCFELKMKKDANYKSIDEAAFLLAVDSLNAPVQLVLSDFKFEVIDENSSTKIIEHTFNYGNFIYKKNAVSNYDYYLPSPSTFKDIPWQLYSQEFLGWYDNPDFKGNPIKVILAADNSKAKTFYGKFDIKFGAATKSDNGGFYSNSQFFVKSVILDAKISKLNPKAGEVVKVAVSGTLSKDYAGSIGVDLYNRTFNDGFLGNEWHYVETKDKKLQTYFEVKINKDANYKSIDDAMFLLALNPESEGEELILSDYKFEFVDKNPFVTTEAESKHVSIKPCAEGFEITVRKLDSEKGDWTYAEIWAEEDGHQTVAGFDLSILNKNKSITFVWPFCEKGKTYNFRFAWTDSNGKYNNQPLSIIASNGKGELNFDALKKIKVTLESNSKEANLCVANFNKENILELVKDYQESITYVGVQFPVISGLNNWSDTQWLFAAYCGLFPEIDSNNSFFAELFSKGKVNLLGDYNFDWGSKEKINEELSKKTTFWTELSVHFNINTSPEGVSFYTNSNKTDNVPYTPVKF